MSDVFISYSRRNGDFAKRLTNALENSGSDVWIDWQDIPRATDWMNAIKDGIESADTFLFIVSEYSLQSEICHRELEHARACHKRIIPIIHQRIEGDVERNVKGVWFDATWSELAKDNWTALTHLNFLFFDDEARFDDEFALLQETLQTDLTHVQNHTRLLVRAREWDASGEKVGFLLVGEELQEAQAWLGSAEGKHPPPSDLHLRYITQSATTETRRSRLMRNLRLASVAFAIVGVLSAIAVIGALISLGDSQQQAQDALALQQTAEQARADADNARETSEAERQFALEERETAVAQQQSAEQAQQSALASLESLRLVNEARTGLEENPTSELVALLAIRALQSAYTDQADLLLRQALSNLYTRDAFAVHPSATGFTMAPDQSHMVLDTRNLTMTLGVNVDGTVRYFIYSGGWRDREYAFSPDSSLLAIAYNDRSEGYSGGDQLHIHDTHDGSLITNIAITKPRHVVFSPDNQYLAVTTSIYGYIQVFLFNVDGTLLGHILPNGETTTTATPTPDEWLNIEALSFNPSGDAVITISPISPFNDIFTVWAIADLLNGESEFVEITEPLITMRTQNDKGTNAYNRTPRMAWLDADRFVSIDDDSNVRVWDIRTGQPDPDFTPWQMVRETGERLTIYDWHLSPIHAHLLVISTDSKARLFDMQTGDVLHIWTAIRDIAYGQSNDEIWLMGAGDDVIRRMVLNNPDVVGDANSASIGALDAHPTEAQYLTSVLGTGGVLQVRDSNTQDILWEINIGEENIITYGVHYSADGTRIIGAVSDGSIRIWDSQTGEEIIRMQNPNIDNQDEITVVPLTVASNLDLTRVATLVYDLRGGDANAPIINIWDLAERRIIHSIDPAGLPDIVGGAMMAYSPDGRYLAGVVTDSVQELGFSEYSSENVRLYFDPMKRLVDEPEDNRYYVVLWDSENDYAPRILGQFDDRSYDLQFLDNATLVTTSQSGDVVFWDVTTGDSRILNNPNDLAGTRTYGFASSPDGRWYAASYTSYIQLWDATTETVVRTIEHPIVSEFTGRWLAFSADSRTLFKGELGVTRYPVTVNDMVTDACQRVYRDFTTEERLVFRLDDNLTCADNPLMTWQYADDESIFVPELTSTADARLLITPSPLPEGVPTVYVYPTPVSNPNASMNLLGSLTPTLEAWQVIGTEDAIMTQAVTATQGYIMTQTATYQPRTTITPSVTPTFTPSPTPIASPTATPSPSATP